MSLYTKTGDKGQTSIFGGKRVPKFDAQVEAYGAIDEASSVIGWVLAIVQDEKVRITMTHVQEQLYIAMGYLAGAGLKDLDRFEQMIRDLEAEIDHYEHILPKLTRFILPQGGETSSRCHIARTTVRAAERRVVLYTLRDKTNSPEDQVIVKFLNRLSDWLFMIARKFSQHEKTT